MSLRREVFIRIIALLQMKTLIETTYRTLKCLKRHYSTVRSMKNVAMLTADGAFALFFRPHWGFDSSRVPTPGNLPSKAKKNAVEFVNNNCQRAIRAKTLGWRGGSRIEPRKTGL